MWACGLSLQAQVGLAKKKVCTSLVVNFNLARRPGLTQPHTEPYAQPLGVFFGGVFPKRTCGRKRQAASTNRTNDLQGKMLADLHFGRAVNTRAFLGILPIVKIP